MSTFKLSNFAFIMSSKGEDILYHSLLMNKCTIEGCIINNKTISLDSPTKIQELKEKGFIIESEQEDTALLLTARNYIQEPYISTAYFFITKNCNLACKYCFEKQSEVSNSNEGIMSIETIDKGLNFFSRLIKLNKDRFNERKTIIFYGGEPFHNKKTLYHAIEAVNKAIEQGCLPTSIKMLIVTNGTLLKSEDIEFIKRNNITLTFSLDGDEKAFANRVFPDMKTTAWSKATQTYKQCKAAGIDLNVACTLTPETIQRQEQVLDYFINNAKITNIGFNAILDNDIIQLGDKYDDSAAHFVSSSYKPLIENGITENRTQRRIQVFSAKKPCLFDCNAAGGRQIAIAPDGEVGICHEHIMDKKHFVTSIYDDDFDPAKSSIYKEWQKRSPLYIDECYQCPALGVCGGGCVINTERKYGTIWKPDPRFCKQTLSILENILL